MHIIDLESLPIFEQLQIEEALLRTSTEEWCLINVGAPPAIVMGISGRPELLLNLPLLQNRPLPCIRRYSGGGTVVVDENTLFVTFICNGEQRNIPPFPRDIMHWSETIYRPFFGDNAFHLRENDYVFGERKCGGNAQYIQKQRWVHHTSFLWDFAPSLMEYLLLPPKRPTYRKDRDHTDFLIPLKEFYPTKSQFFLNLKQHLAHVLNATEITKQDLALHLQTPHRQNTMLMPAPMIS